MTQIYTQDDLQAAKNKVAEIEEAIKNQRVPASRLRLRDWCNMRLCQVGRETFQWISIRGDYNRLSDTLYTRIGSIDRIDVTALQAKMSSESVYVVADGAVDAEL